MGQFKGNGPCAVRLTGMTTADAALRGAHHKAGAASALECHPPKMWPSR